jgi:hypothetical protein
VQSKIDIMKISQHRIGCLLVVRFVALQGCLEGAVGQYQSWIPIWITIKRNI